MMEAITRKLLLGTSKLGPTVPPTGETEALVARANPPDAETRLLLEAGAAAVYGQAGRKPLPVNPPPEPASGRDKPMPAAQATRLIEAMFAGDYRELLPEGLECIQTAGFRLPDHLLPAALDMRDEKLRAALVGVLGGRGLWLSRFNPEWAWAITTARAAAEALPDDAAEIWDSGPINQREAVLRQLRRLEPARAREWLQQSWLGEKADNRGRLLAVFEIGLSREDEAFLVQALSNRTSRIRAQAAELLVRIEDSAFLGKIRERVDDCLSYAPAVARTAAPRLKSLVGRNPAGALAVSVPHDVEPAWKKEGIISAPMPGRGPHPWWLSRMIGLVPPLHWQRRFNLTPGELLRLHVDDEWNAPVVVGWTLAALLHDAREWFAPLWDHWMSPAGALLDEGLLGGGADGMLGSMLSRMPPQDATERITRLVDEGRALISWLRAIEFLPRPWPAQVARAYLRQVRARIKSAPQVSSTEAQTLGLAARSLPPECFDEALADWSIPEGENYQLCYLRREVTRFTEIVLLRQRLMRELTAPE